ncbi:LysM peptidoglycan-binding domain-containing protein [Jiella pacifica]|uniref:LysM peptidoglycan-binding domain-containing protein n=1 Tax=Jiella pacifica TaxID=2696469 RepID=A0A6N9T6M0_9HYPH|nr:LysM peptidoglycan-binding domain-containing protein [Jiella pacifica]NDW07037.1 LysM peptidoglycan-binding domain-containing protein [Jiella pacifica]
MQRRALGILLFCLVLLVAIIAGYWDMLESEKLRIADRGEVSPPVREGTIDPTGFSAASEPSETAAAGSQGEAPAEGRAAIDRGEDAAREDEDAGKEIASRVTGREAATPSGIAAEDEAETSEAASPQAGGSGGVNGANTPSDAVAAPDSPGADRLAAGKSDRRSGGEGTVMPSGGRSQAATSVPSGGDGLAAANAGTQPSTEPDADPAKAGATAGNEAASDRVAGGEAQPGQPGAASDGAPETAGTSMTETNRRQAAAGLEQPAEASGASASRPGESTAMAPGALQETTDTASASAGHDGDVAEAGHEGGRSAGDGAVVAAEASEDAAPAAAGAPSEAVGAGGPRVADADEPRFDILRVEPDGSTLVAGRSAPNSTVTLRDGDETLGSDKAGRDGDFVIVLDRPLQPGDHSIQIHSEDESGSARTSRETAVVSVPQDGRAEDLLAMIEEPGAPSRLIDTPAARAPATGTQAGEPVDERASAASKDGAPGGSATGVDAASVARLEAPVDAAAEPADGAGANGSDVAGLTSSQGEAATPPADGESVVADSSGSAGEAAGTESPAGQRQASVAPSASALAETTGPAAAEAPLRVEAVEIDDGKIFIAGSAEPGTRFRVYVDNQPFAAGTADRNGRFVVSSDQQLSVGDHLIRVDQLSGASDVTARVEVPFFRPEGNSLAAVAENEAGPDRMPELAAADVPQAASEPQTTSTAAAAPVEQAEAAPQGREEPIGPASTEVAEPEIAERQSPRGEATSGGEPQPASTATDDDPTTAPGAPPASDGQRQDEDTQLAARLSGGSSAPEPAASSGPGATADAPTFDRAAAAAAGESNDEAAASGAQSVTPSPANANANANSGSRIATDGAPSLDPLGALAPGAAGGVTDGLAEADGETTRGGRVVAQRRDADGREEAGTTEQAEDTQGELSDRTASSDGEGAGEPANAGGATASASGGEATAEADTSAPGPDAAGSVTPLAEEDRQGDVASADKSGRVPLLRQPALAAAKSSRVIIRKGDTLWRISRDSYGAGHRYTVIYLANGDQIRDPNLIYPGQVFRMPEEQRSEAAGENASSRAVE